MYHKTPPPVLLLPNPVVLAGGFGYKSGVVLRPFFTGSFLLCLAACGMVRTSSEQPLHHLTAALRVTGALEMSRLSYQDACGNRRDFALGLALEDAFQQTIAEAFSGTGAPSPPAKGPDRVLDVDLDTGELILFVEKGVARRYPAGVTLSVDVTALDGAGTQLDRHRLRTHREDTVYTEADLCAVMGIERLASEAVAALAEELGHYLRANQSIALGTGSPEAPGPAVALTFRARVLDADGDQILQGEEEVTLEVEVTNVGSKPAREVRATLSGSLELVRQLPRVMAFGDLQPGESKRQAVTARLGKVAAAGQAELVLSLTSRSAMRQAPARKKFLIMLRPKQTAGWMPHRGAGDRGQRGPLPQERAEAGHTVPG